VEQRHPRLEAWARELLHDPSQDLSLLIRAADTHPMWSTPLAATTVRGWLADLKRTKSLRRKLFEVYLGHPDVDAHPLLFDVLHASLAAEGAHTWQSELADIALLHASRVAPARTAEILSAAFERAWSDEQQLLEILAAMSWTGAAAHRDHIRRALHHPSLDVSHRAQQIIQNLDALPSNVEDW